MSARRPPITRALLRAIALCKGVLEDDRQPCRNLVKGATPRELRAEEAEYHKLLTDIEPPPAKPAVRAPYHGSAAEGNC
jgi:hypothetical protein